jgi:hypothetical protein
MNATLTDFVTEAGHRPGRHSAAYQLHQAGHQFSNLASHNPEGFAWILAIVALVVLLTIAGIKRVAS